VDTRPCNVLSICSGYGGIELGLHAALDGRTRTVCYVENELGVASILAARMEDGSLDPASIWSDLHTFDPEPWRGKVDILAGGFPCQPHSVAGSQLGEDDPRELSGEVLRIADGLGLPVLFLENVPGICQFYWDNIRPELRKMGYEVAEGLFTASETGAPHKRERLFILAHAAMDDSEHDGLPGPERSRGVGLRARDGEARTLEPEQPAGPSSGAGRDNQLADAERRSPERLGHNLAPTSRGVEGEVGEQRLRADTGDGGNELAHAGLPLYPPGPNDARGWEWLLARWPGLAPTYCKEGHDVQPEMPTTQRDIRGASHGAMSGVDRRLRAVGNGVVPAVAALAFRELTKQLAIPP
jgi:DNA (cytosine-5)-methyltransferase 1